MKEHDFITDVDFMKIPKDSSRAIKFIVVELKDKDNSFMFVSQSFYFDNCFRNSSFFIYIR